MILKRKRTRSILYIVLVILVLYLIHLYSGLFQPERLRLDPFPTDHDSLLLFAHRGMVGYFPENSMVGFIAAHEMGFEAIELDVRMTADYHIVIFHDENGKRLTGNDLIIRHTTLDTLRSQPILFEEKPSSSYVLLLSEYFRNMPVSLPVYIDIKTIKDFNKKMVLDSILQVVREWEAESIVILASSDLFLLRYIQKKESGVRTALEGFGAGKEWIHWLIPPSWRPDYYSGFASRVDAGHIKWLRDKNLLDRRIVYNVDSNNFSRLRNTGIRCMIIDYDRYLDETLQMDQALADSILNLH